MTDRKYYEKEISKILGEYQHESVTFYTYLQSKIIELVMMEENERNLKEIYNFVSALVTK